MNFNNISKMVYCSCKILKHVFCKYSACKSATLHAIYIHANAVIAVACTVVRPSLCLNALDPAK